MEIDTEILQARKLIIPPVEIDLRIVLVGCGGTGSWLAPHIARTAKVLGEKIGRYPEVIFFDPDAVEGKNCYRQNFSIAEIGMNKARALATRYNSAWGLDIKIMEIPFDGDRTYYHNYNRWTLFIGCVDNRSARLAIDYAVCNGDAEETTWWLDCGNAKSSGQVLIGRSRLRAGEIPLMLGGQSTWAPIPSWVHPDLIDTNLDDIEVSANVENLSCVEMALQNAQSLSINARVAAEAADFLIRFLVFRDLRRYAAYLSLDAGSTKSLYVTEDNLKPYMEVQNE